MMNHAWYHICFGCIWFCVYDLAYDFAVYDFTYDSFSIPYMIPHMILNHTCFYGLPCMIWFQSYMIWIKTIYGFEIIYDLTYDLTACWNMICFNIIYGSICGLAQWSYKHPYMVENGRYMIWNPCPHMIWNPYMIPIYGLDDIWSHIWSIKPMGWCMYICQYIIRIKLSWYVIVVFEYSSTTVLYLNIRMCIKWYSIKGSTERITLFN